MSSNTSSSERCIDNFLRCLSRHDPNIPVYTPNDSRYYSVLQCSIQNLRFCAASTSNVKRPLVIVTPLKDSHVQAAVICCKECHLQLKIRSNGHDYEGLSYVSDVPFVVMDMLRLNCVQIDAKEGTAWVGGGATLGEVYYNITKNSPNHAFPAGICPTVGVGGHFSGGGFGTMVRKHGLSSDNILDARLVNAKGEILNKASMGEDLFWAIRGGGGESFGVILAWKIRLVPIPKLVTIFGVARTLKQGATALIHKWQDIAHRLPDELYLKVLFHRGKAASQEEGSFTVKATFQALFLGETKQLLNIMEQRFPQLGVKSEDCKEMSWIESTLYSATLDPTGPLEILLHRTFNRAKNETQLTQTKRIFFKSTSDYVKEPLSETALEGIWKIFFDPSVKQPYMLWTPSGGALSRVAPSETPYPHRKNLYMIEYMALWDDKGTEVADTNKNWLRRLYRYMEPYVSKGPREAYYNFRDLDLGRSKYGTTGATYEEAKAWGVRYFMGNFDRLVKVKTKVDPENFFKSEQSIPVNPRLAGT